MKLSKIVYYRGEKFNVEVEPLGDGCSSEFNGLYIKIENRHIGTQEMRGYFKGETLKEKIENLISYYGSGFNNTYSEVKEFEEWDGVMK